MLMKLMKFQHPSQCELAACSHWPVSLGLSRLMQHGVKLNNVRLHRYNMQTVRQHWDAASLCPLTLPPFCLFVPALKIVVLKTTRMTAVHCRPLWPPASAWWKGTNSNHYGSDSSIKFHSDTLSSFKRHANAPATVREKRLAWCTSELVTTTKVVKQQVALKPRILLPVLFKPTPFWKPLMLQSVSNPQQLTVIYVWTCLSGGGQEERGKAVSI